jgi:hypothetical protein
MCVVLYLTALACGPSARSRKPFDDIRSLVAGKTEAEVERLLGAPDHREDLPLGDERWIWWNYTYLGGKGWAPEWRDKVVHLEITFAAPIVAPVGSQGRSSWRVSEPYGVGYVMPDNGENHSTSLNKTVRGGV